MADHGKHAFHDGSRALAPQETKALGPTSIKDEVKRLAGLGYYGIPVHVTLKSNRKKSTMISQQVGTHKDSTKLEGEHPGHTRSICQSKRRCNPNGSKQSILLGR